MAAKPRIPMGKLIPFPIRTLSCAPGSTKIAARISAAGAKHRLDEVTSDMIAAEQALFVALRLAKKSANGSGDQPPIQPPPRTSSSRKKTAA
jgi:hypothetical protein